MDTWEAWGSTPTRIFKTLYNLLSHLFALYLWPFLVTLLRVRHHSPLALGLKSKVSHCSRRLPNLYGSDGICPRDANDAMSDRISRRWVEYIADFVNAGPLWDHSDGNSSGKEGSKLAPRQNPPSSSGDLVPSLYPDGPSAITQAEDAFT